MKKDKTMESETKKQDKKQYTPPRLDLPKLREENAKIVRHICFLKRGKNGYASSERKEMMEKYPDLRRAKDRATLLCFIRAWHRDRIHSDGGLFRNHRTGKYEEATFFALKEVEHWVGDRFGEFRLPEQEKATEEVEGATATP